MKIEIYGAGCERCAEVEKKVIEALKYLSLEAVIVKVDDLAKISERGIHQTPTVVINGDLKCTGRIPDTRELHNWITTAAIQEDTK